VWSSTTVTIKQDVCRLPKKNNKNRHSEQLRRKGDEKKRDEELTKSEKTENWPEINSPLHLNQWRF